MELSLLDYWRLADDLSVMDASYLIVGADPFGGPRSIVHSGRGAVFKALRTAVMTNKLQAQVRYPLGRAHDYSKDYNPNVESQVNYDYLITRNDKGKQSAGETRTNFDLDELRACPDLYVWKEPNWDETYVSTDDLKRWLSSRNLYPSFFFPEGTPEGFRDSKHPRYAPKLAACVAAWEAVTKPANNSTVKRTLEGWLQSNAAAFGVGDEAGIVSSKTAAALASIVNWNPIGGAPKTGGEVDETGGEVLASQPENYPNKYIVHDEIAECEGEIPF